MKDMYDVLGQAFTIAPPYSIYDYMSDDINKALDFAENAHGGLVRKYTGLPYITHCLEVANAMWYVEGVTLEAIQAALLHDVVEDTNRSLDEIRFHFGEKVAEYVWYLTSPPKFVGDRNRRLALNRDRLRHAPRMALEIKCADIISNCLNIAVLDPAFARTYLNEKRIFIEELAMAPPITLLPLARQVVWDGLERLSLEQELF